MTEQTFRKIKKQNGEAFAQVLRKSCPQAYQLEDLPFILRHAGRDPEDAKALTSWLAAQAAEKTLAETALALEPWRIEG